MSHLRIIGKWLILPAGLSVLLFFYAQTAWWHWHRLPDGNLVGHAHPYHPDHNSPIQQHPHTNAQIGFFSHLSTGSATIDDNLPLNFGLFDIAYNYLSYDQTFAFSAEAFSLPSLRAPPSLLFN